MHNHNFEDSGRDTVEGATIYACECGETIAGDDAAQFVPPLTFTLTITLGNEAMEDLSDVSTALQSVMRATQTEYDSSPEIEGAHGSIRDLNGNTVGEWCVS